MANPELPGNAPQNNLGVKSMNRGNLINFLLFRDFVKNRRTESDGDGGGGGRGRTKLEMENDMAILEHEYKLKDDFARARTANEVEKFAQIDANALHAADTYFAGGVIPGVSQAHTPKVITGENRPAEGSAKGSGGTAIAWKGGKEPTPVKDRPPVKEEPQGEFNTKDKIRKLEISADKVSKRMKPLTPTQVEDANADWEDFHKAKQDEAKEAGVEIDDDLRNEIRTQYLQGKFSTGKETLPGNYKPDKEVRQWIRETPTVNPEDGTIDTGEGGSRPQPGGETGVEPGQQFTDSSSDEPIK